MGIASRVALMLLGVMLLLPQTASAHVLVTDTSGTLGGILHVMPDDDPIAGRQDDIFFDIQSGNTGFSPQQATLQISDIKGQVEEVPVSMFGNLVIAAYAFPIQGIYDLRFTVTSGTDTYTFIATQRVSRGLADDTLAQPTYAWAEIGILFCGSGLAVLAIIAYNRRKEIKAYSKW